MLDAYERLVQRILGWTEQAQADGWLTETDRARIERVERRTPGELFADASARPLVVALFGGTGAGKSSLLNRLAGAPLARTSAERPTSHEVTAYVHVAVEFTQLPEGLPLAPEQVKRHESDTWRDVLWIDAPDIDSVDEANRRQALAWLPHVDVVCYVVSPERYRDDVGWQQLLERSHRHGWIFLMNRWDEGDPRQADDFAAMLNAAGFEAPILLRTCCLADRELPTPDEFDQVQSVLRSALAAHGIEEMARLGHRARLNAFRQVLEGVTRRFGDPTTWEKVRRAADQRWEHTAATICSGLEWPMQALSQRLASGGRRLVSMIQAATRTLRGTGDAPPDDETPSPDEVIGRATELWDAWAQSKLAAWIDGMEVELRSAGLAADPVRSRLEATCGDAGGRVGHHLQEHVLAALARPGCWWKRIARRVTGFAMVFLPTMALLWVGWTVAEGYYRATRGERPYFGTPFAVHSVLLVLLSWALPFACDRWLKPSLVAAAKLGLRRGLRAGLDEVQEQLRAALGEQQEQATARREVGDEIISEIDRLLATPWAPASGTLRRLVARPASDVRAARRT